MAKRSLLLASFVSAHARTAVPVPPPEAVVEGWNSDVLSSSCDEPAHLKSSPLWEVARARWETEDADAVSNLLATFGDVVVSRDSPDAVVEWDGTPLDSLPLRCGRPWHT